jgi:hypothetical protein
MTSLESFEEDFEKWCKCKLIKKCNDCDFKGNISQMDRITCSKKCGYIAFECDNCGSTNEKVLIENKLSSKQLKDHVKYTLNKTEISGWWIWICNKCKKENDEEEIIKNIDTLLNSNDDCTGPYSNDSVGNRIYPPIKENDFNYNLKRILN